MLPETWRSWRTRLSVPESASMVPVLLSVPLTRIVDVLVPAVFSIVPAFSICSLAAGRVVDSRVGLDQVRRPRLDLQNGRVPGCRCAGRGCRCRSG